MEPRRARNVSKGGRESDSPRRRPQLISHDACFITHCVFHHALQSLPLKKRRRQTPPLPKGQTSVPTVLAVEITEEAGDKKVCGDAETPAHSKRSAALSYRNSEPSFELCMRHAAESSAKRIKGKRPNR